MALFEVYPLYDITPVRASDVYIFDDKGKKYLDLYGGHAVISIGHSQPDYVKALQYQLSKMAFYSNAVHNPLQESLSQRLCELSCCQDYKLFLCNSGAEANENALKLASFRNGRTKIVAFKNSFHGRTSAAVVATDNPKIVSPLNAQQQVVFLDFGDIMALEQTLAMGDICSVIFETIQGVGGLDESTTEFYQAIERLGRKYQTLIIADEVQSGFGRTGDFFAFQKHGITPDIISMAKGMANGFPIGGILIHPDISARHGMLGTTFGGNHLACQAAQTVLEVIDRDRLMNHVRDLSDYIFQCKWPEEINFIKGRGLMLGFEFGFEVGELRKRLIYEKQIFTGGSANKNLLRILPPLTIKREHIDYFRDSLYELLV